jgi:hypothetical protein
MGKNIILDYVMDKHILTIMTKKNEQHYWARHLGNATEYKLITNLVPSPSLFSAYILWGIYPDIEKNINYLNQLWREKHELKN